MNLRISLIVFFLFGIGIFANAQDKKQSHVSAKPTVENGADAIPVIVTSSARKSKPKPPKAPEPVKFTPPVIVKDADKKLPAPPPPPTIKKKKTGDIPPAAPASKT